MPELESSQPASPIPSPAAPATPAPEAPPVKMDDLEIQTIPDQFYGTALHAKAPKSLPVKHPAVPANGKIADAPSADPHARPSVPRWVIPVVAVVVLLGAIGGGFWYFNPQLFAKKAPAVETEVVVPPPPPTPPAAPTNVVATSTSGGGVSLTWTDASDNETGFRIERRESTTAYVPLSSLPAGSTVFLDSSTLWETSYLYRVVAVNADGESVSSMEATIQLPTDPNAPKPVAELPPAGLDTDSDGLTDVEEPLYGSPVRNPDADGDTFLDGNEVYHLYNPSAKAPGRLLDAGYVRLFESSLGWRVLVPTTWQAVVEENGAKGTVYTGRGEIFTFEVMDIPSGQSALDWFLAANPGVLSSQVETIVTKSGLEGFQGPDLLTVYFPWGNRVMVFRYDLDAQPFVNFRTTFEMMKNSLQMDVIVETPAVETTVETIEETPVTATSTTSTT